MNAPKALFDVVQVSMKSGKVNAILDTGVSERCADSIISMAIARRGVRGKFYAAVPCLSLAIGSVYHSPNAGTIDPTYIIAEQMVRANEEPIERERIAHTK